MYKVDLSTDEPEILEKKAKLNLSRYYTMTGERGVSCMFRHFLHWVWDEVRDPSMSSSTTRGAYPLRE